jgi:hypothetical protein
MDHKNETDYRRNHQFGNEKAGAQYKEPDKIFRRSDRNGHRLQHPVPLPDDI